MLDLSGPKRLFILNVSPQVDCGRFAAKRLLDDVLHVSCDVISDGHDLVDGVVCWSNPENSEDESWHEVPLQAKGNDGFFAEFKLNSLGRYQFCVEAWIDEYGSWCHGLHLKHEAGVDVSLELRAGSKLLEDALERIGHSEVETRTRLVKAIEDVSTGNTERRILAALDAEVRGIARRYPCRRFSTRSPELEVVVEPKLAGFSAWYELFPRSCGKDGKHGTFQDVEALLPYVADMGFDILYFPPIHPIGTTFRKGPNNTLQAGPNDPGSPWAIGAADGGHKEIHQELGTVNDFIHLVKQARRIGLEIALDIAFQASPDHPYVKEHPEWFVHRPDGTIQYAENPPKKYQDVYPFDLAGPAWRSLWEELKDVFEVWIDRGVRVFRVDNPHTKPLPFWEYCITELKRAHPDVLFLAEAFTRPKLMYALAKVGFSQSYTYFTWRTNSEEFREYLTELTAPPVSDFFRPNFWPNTPDILPEHLQTGDRAMFIARAILAGTLSSNWGIYGPAFELMERIPRTGAEEYIDNEKFQLRAWDLDSGSSLRPIVAQINRIRRENQALHANETIAFHASDNKQIIAYSKTDAKSGNVILSVVSLETQYKHSAWLTLNLEELLVAEGETFVAHDLLSSARFSWSSSRVYVELDPQIMPAHVLRIERG